MTNAQLELLNALLEGRSIILGCIQQYLNSNKNNQIAYLTPIDQISHLFLSSEINLSELLKKLKLYNYHIEALLKRIDIGEALEIIKH